MTAPPGQRSIGGAAGTTPLPSCTGTGPAVDPVEPVDWEWPAGRALTGAAGSAWPVAAGSAWPVAAGSAWPVAAGSA